MKIMATKKEMEELLDEYLKAKQASEKADLKFKVCQSRLKEAMGDKTSDVVNGLVISYKFDTAIDEAKLKEERIDVWASCLKEPELDTTRFRKEYPELLDTYLMDSKKRPLKVTI
jgi:hypothetical protein